MRCELREVLRRGVRVDDAAARVAGQADVRQRRERAAVRMHLLERRERGEKTGAVVGADRGDVQLRQTSRGLGGLHAGERLGRLVEGHQRDDRQARHAAHGLDRIDELLEVVEGLDHEEVGAAALEDRRLLGEQVVPQARRGRLADRADRAGDEDLAAGHVARLPRELDRRGVDRLDVVLEEVARELAAVGAEAVRLDQLRAGVDVADVERDDDLRRAEVRLLGRPQPRHRGRHQRAHPAVGDDRRPRGEPLAEARHDACTVRPSMPPAIVTTCPVTWPERTSEARTTTWRGDVLRLRDLAQRHRARDRAHLLGIDLAARHRRLGPAGSDGVDARQGLVADDLVLEAEQQAVDHRRLRRRVVGVPGLAEDCPPSSRRARASARRAAGSRAR